MKVNIDYKPNNEFITAIRGLRFTMRFLGIWQQPNLRGWYNSVWYIQSIGLVFNMFGPTAGLIVNRHDASKTIKNLGILTPMTCAFFNWITFAVHSKTIGKILHFIEEDWINLEKDTLIGQSVPESKRLVEKQYRFAKNFFFTFVGLMTFGTITYLHDSLSSINLSNNATDYERDNLFLIPCSWFPLDYSRGYTVQILYVTQTITVTTITLAYASISNFFLTITLHLCAQFQILRYFIESITFDFSRPEYCSMKVRLMIRRYEELLRAAERIQKSYNFIIVEQYAAATLTICFLGYAIIAEIEKMNPNVTVVVKIAFDCGAFLLLIFSYCFVGDRLINQSLAVAMAVYNSDWYNCPLSIRRSFLLVMARAHRPVEISGANLLPMSLESFTNLMKASASYLSVLRAMGVNAE